MMEVVERIVANGHGYLNASYLVIHSTANPGASALNHVSYWQNNPNVPMAHYVGDWTGKVYHCVPDDRICWHVGTGNGWTVGIELCEPAKATDFEPVWRMGVEFAAYYLNKRGWGIDRLLSHNDCIAKWGGTDHTDPIPFFKRYGHTWEEFKNDVETELIMADINYELLADRIADKLMRYELTSNNGFRADIGRRICIEGDKSQTIHDTLLRIEKEIKK